MEVNCGSCKWLDVPPEDLTKDGRTKKIRDCRMYRCVVAFTKPTVPHWYPLPNEKHFSNHTCPSYGKNCPMHESRK